MKFSLKATELRERFRLVFIRYLSSYSNVTRFGK